MSQSFQPGDFLVFQLEAGFGLLRVLGVEDLGSAVIWHLRAYNEFFPDVDSAVDAAERPENLSVSLSHAALTNRAFESTQVARIASSPLTDADTAPLSAWQASDDRVVSDRSIRLLLGLR